MAGDRRCTLGGTIPVPTRDPSHDACTTVVAKGPELDCLVRVMTATVAWCGVACTGASRVRDDLFISCVCSFLPTWGGLRARPTNINTSSTIDTTRYLGLGTSLSQFAVQYMYSKVCTVQRTVLVAVPVVVHTSPVECHCVYTLPLAYCTIIQVTYSRLIPLHDIPLAGFNKLMTIIIQVWGVERDVHRLDCSGACGSKMLGSK